MPNFHPLLVHFPIALIFVIVATDLLAMVFKRRIFSDAGTVMIGFALAGAAAAVISGLIAEESVWHTEAAPELIETHETAALIFLGALVLLTAFRIVFRKRIAESLGWLSLLGTVICAAMVGYVAFLGGEMVFVHGTGVIQAEVQTARADSLAESIKTPDNKTAIDNSRRGGGKNHDELGDDHSGRHH